MSLARKLGRLGYFMFVLPSAVITYNSNRSRVLVISDGKILVTKRLLDSGKWSLPGGGITKHEQPINSAARELREETKLDLSNNQFKFIGEARLNESLHHFNVFYFKAELKDKNLARRSMETVELDWLEPTKLNASNSESDILTALKLVQDR